MGKLRLNIGFVIDNSASTEEATMDIIKQGLERISKQIKSDFFEFSVIVYNQLEPIIIKKYDGPLDLNLIMLNQMPFLGKALLTSIDYQEKYIGKNKDDYFKPWQVIITGGRCYDSLEVAFNKIRDLENRGSLFTMPIALRKITLAEQHDEVRNYIKKPITIINYKCEELFKWLTELIQQRLALTENTGLKLDRQALEGWAYL